MNTKQSLLIAYLITFVLSCSTSKNTIKERNDKAMNYRELATEKLGEKVSFIANTDSSYMLCLTSKLDVGVKYILFFVFDLQNNEIIYEPQRRMRKAAWISNSEIRADILTGMPVNEGTDDYIVYNVIEKRIISPRN